MMRAALSIIALCEALATLSYTTTPRLVSQNSRFLGPLELSIERAGSVGGGTIYGVNLLGEGNDNRQNFVGDGSATTYQSTLTYVAFSNYNWLVKIDKTTMTGTVTVTAGSTTVTGSSTDFDPEASIGDEIMVNGETRRIASITSDTVLVVDEAFVNAASAVAIYKLDTLLRQTTDFTLSSVGGKTLITITAAAKAPVGAKFSLHYVTPVALYTFATATVQFKRHNLPTGYDALWYVSGSTTSPSATNIYLRPVGE